MGDFKRYINKPNYKFFFQSYDDDFGLVKEEITKDNAILPKTQEGKIVCFLTPGDVDKKQVKNVIFHQEKMENLKLKKKSKQKKKISKIQFKNWKVSQKF